MNTTNFDAILNETTFAIRGYLVGPIWWPVGAECWKELRYDISDEAVRWTSKGSLRDHIVAASCHDGDFQSASIACGELVATRRQRKEGRTVTVERSWPLEAFPSVADCLHPEGQDWFPSFSDDDFEEDA